MDAKCVAKCISVCPIQNVYDTERCRIYESGRTAIIKPYLQYLRCPIHKNNKVEWEKVESEAEGE